MRYPGSVPLDDPGPPPEDHPSEVPWEDLVEWAESDLRRQLAHRLGPGNQVTPSSVIGSTFRRAATKRSSLPRRFRDACNWLFTVAGHVASEKNRNARALKRRPRDAAVLPVGEKGELLTDSTSPGQRQQLEEALELLPDEYAALVRAVYFEGLSLREFAEREGMAPREASRLHRRALERLRGLLPAN